MDDGVLCEACLCLRSVAASKAEARGPSFAEAFPGGFREGYCCQCYDKLVSDVIAKKKAQAARDAREKREAESKKASSAA